MRVRHVYKLLNHNTSVISKAKTYDANPVLFIGLIVFFTVVL